jgi:hypothetical protein
VINQAITLDDAGECLQHQMLDAYSTEHLMAMRHGA